MSMKVLSLFDGCSCARLALSSLGVSCDYYASEIDKYAQRVSDSNFADIHRLGDINNIDFKALGKFDLVIGGSPCTDLSISKRDRKGLAGDQSALFYKFLEAVETIKPTYFLLENVASMSKANKEEISRLMGVTPVNINSSLLTAQLRNRLYWCNWEVSQPADRGIELCNILENGWTDKAKSLCLDASYFKGASARHYLSKSVRQLVFNNWPADYGDAELRYSKGARLTPDIQYRPDGSRLLTSVECERLQGIPDNFTAGVSNTQRYKMIGNGFTVPVISHILKEIVAA